MDRKKVALIHPRSNNTFTKKECTEAEGDNIHYREWKA